MTCASFWHSVESWLLLLRGAHIAHAAFQYRKVLADYSYVEFDARPMPLTVMAACGPCTFPNLSFGCPLIQFVIDSARFSMNRKVCQWSSFAKMEQPTQMGWFSASRCLPVQVWQVKQTGVMLVLLSAASYKPYTCCDSSGDCTRLTQSLVSLGCLERC